MIHPVDREYFPDVILNYPERKTRLSITVLANHFWVEGDIRHFHDGGVPLLRIANSKR